jgi:hypothetical protein
MNNQPLVHTSAYSFAEISKVKVWIPMTEGSKQGTLANLHPEEVAGGVVVRVMRPLGYALNFEESDWLGNLTQDEFDSMMRGREGDTSSDYRPNPDR